ncbi:Cys-tRNA(Pro) deacylase [Roseibium sp. M-1]
MTVTRATQVLTRAGVPFELLFYEYDPSAAEIGRQAAEALGIDPSRLLKSLMLEAAGKALIAVIPTDRQLDLKALAGALKTKTCKLMPKPAAERISGYLIGGISPIGQKRKLTTVIDRSVAGYDWIVLNGGRRGLQIKVSPHAIAEICEARFEDITG